MKKRNLFWMTAVALLIAGCASSTAGTEGVTPSNESGTTIAAMKSTIRDWQGRSLNAPAIPAWLEPATRSDFRPYETASNFQEGSGLFRFSIGYGADVRAATMRADMNYARIIARELQQSISVFAAEQALAGNMDQQTATAIEERTKTQTQADITGHQKRTEFWQLVETEDPKTRRTTRQYVMYQIYSINPDAWAATTAKYIKQVVGDTSLSREQKVVSDMVTQMMDDARHPTVLSQEQAKAKLDAEQRMLNAQINLMPAQQEAAARAELAKINQDAITARTTAAAEQRTAQTQALADGRAQQAAYLSGDPALKAAASVTPADAAWVNAMRIASSILF